MTTKMKNHLHNTDITIFQKKEMFRMNTDTRYLGEFMKIKKGEQVLDIGTNNGALLLYANQYHPSHLYGVDILEEAIALCKENLEYNNIENYTLYNEDIKDVKGLQVDVIVCNPPYFQVHHQAKLNENHNLQVARHERYLEMEDLFLSMKRLIKDNGRFYLVHRANRIVELLSIAQNNGFGIRTIQFIHDEKRDDATGVLIEGIKGQKNNVRVLNPIVVKR